MADVTIAGKKYPKWAVYTSGVVGLGIFGYVYYQHKKNAASSSVASSTDTIDPLTGLPVSQDNTVDPATGLTYLQEAEQYGSVSAADAAISSGAAAGYGFGTFPLTGSAGVGSFPVEDFSGTPVGTQTGTNYTSNADWAQAATAGLESIGYTATDISAALGHYLANLPLTSTQASIVYAALAEYGNPPVGTFQVILAPSPPPATTGTDVNVPNVVGVDVEQATSILHSVGLKASGPAGVKNVVHVVTSTSPSVGSKVESGSTVTLHYKSVQEHVKR